jgi:hypothetical protein
MRYISFDPEAKVIGLAMLGFRASADKGMIEPLLAKYGLTDIQPDQWYPLQPWLDILSDISEQVTDYISMLTFVNIGVKVAANIPHFDEMAREMGIIDYLMAFGSAAYYRDHQGNVGSHVMEKVSANHVKLLVNTPYPPDFWYGIMYGITKKYCQSFIIQYEDMAMRHYAPGETVVIHMIVE